MEESKQNIKSLILEELEAAVTGLGLKKYRAGQIFDWLYKHAATSFQEMTNISSVDRALLAERFDFPLLPLLKMQSAPDGTKKFLFGLQDRHTIESVLIPDEDRKTLCISSQVGCAQACRFCLTGSGGFRRNLEAYEIAEQVVAVERLLEQDQVLGETVGDSPRVRQITNIVLMGMGEPLANFENVVKALRIITGEIGIAFSPRRVTVSTDGLVPEIDRLGKSGLKVNLAVSLNATTDQVRDRIMPVNRRYPISELIAACRRFPLEPRRRITFEYVLLRGVNDSAEDALRLARLVRGIKCKINLIPFNPFAGSEFKRPDDSSVRRFQKILLDHQYTAPVRESRGREISAACGQLREQVESAAAS